MGRRLRNHNEPQVWRRSCGLIAGNFWPLSISARSEGRSLASMAFRRCSSETSTSRISGVPSAFFRPFNLPGPNHFKAFTLESWIRQPSQKSLPIQIPQRFQSQFIKPGRLIWFYVPAQPSQPVHFATQPCPSMLESFFIRPIQCNHHRFEVLTGMKHVQHVPVNTEISE